MSAKKSSEILSREATPEMANLQRRLKAGCEPGSLQAALAAMRLSVAKDSTGFSR